MKGRYAIGSVAKLTGLPIDTLRAWERRYGIVRPERDEAGARRYDDPEIARLELARAATELGHPIRRIATLTTDEIAKIVGAKNQREADPAAAGPIVDKVLGAIGRYDLARAEKLLNTAALLLAPDELVLTVLSPLMHSVGAMWEKGRLSIAQEHLISNLVRNLVGNLVRFRPPESGPVLAFATPPHEPHEFGIALAACLASMQGFRSCVLGPGVPVQEVVRVARYLKAAIVVIGSTLDAASKLFEYVTVLRDGLAARTQLWVGGERPAGDREHSWPARVDRIPTLVEFSRRLAFERT